MSKPQRKPRAIHPDEQELIKRLREDGVEVTPATAGVDHPLPQPLDLGFSLSEAVIELRRWPGEPLEGWPRETKSLDWLPDLSVQSPRRLRPIHPDEQAVIDALRADGVEATPATAGPDHPLPRPLNVGVSLSETVVELRREP